MTSHKEGRRDLRYALVWKSLAWGLLLFVVALTLIPNPPQIVPFLSWDKAQHSIAYAVLIWTFLQAWEGAHTLRWLVLLVVVGVGLEVIQLLMGVRFMEYTDMLANSLGVLLGYLAWRTPLGELFLRVEAMALGA